MVGEDIGTSRCGEGRDRAHSGMMGDTARNPGMAVPISREVYSRLCLQTDVHTWQSWPQQNLKQ